LIALSIIATAMILILYWYSLRKGNHNGFTRVFKKDVITLVNTKDIKYNSYYFAGIAPDKVFLGNFTAPSQLLICDRSLKDTMYARLIIPIGNKVAIDHIRVSVNFPALYLVDEFTNKIYSTTFPSMSCDSIASLSITGSDDIIPLSYKSCIVRAYDTILKKAVIGKIPFVNNKLLINPSILTRQIDGIFCTDGKMCKALNGFVYAYYYRNEFISFDSDLNIIYRARTLDTNTIAKLHLDTIQSDKVVTQSAPPLIVTRQLCADSDYIYINSALVADNEKLTNFNNNAVIDVFSASKGVYEYSFYLPYYKGIKPSEYRVNKKQLFALYSHYILVFQLNI
jgi:hypothetical protein